MSKSDKPKLDDLNTRIDEMLETGRQSQQEWADLWADGLNYIFNNQLSGKDRKNFDPIQVNYIYPAVAQEQAVMAQRRVDLLVKPQEIGDKEAAAVWGPILKWQRENEIDIAMLKIAASLDAKTHGHYIAKVYWEPQLEWVPEKSRYRGGIQVNLVPPSFFGCDPDAEKIDGAAYVFSHRRVLVDWAKQRWPNMADKIEEAADAEGENPHGFVVPGESTPVNTDSGPNELEGRLVSLLAKARGGEAGGQTQSDPTGRQRSRYVTLTEIYFKDFSMTTKQESEPVPAEELLASGDIRKDGEIYRVAKPARFDGLKAGDVILSDEWPTRVKNTWKEPKYPFGRVVLRIGQDCILNPKEEDQVWHQRHWPYVVGVNALLPHVWQGLNGVEMGRGLQDWINISAAVMAEYVKQHSRPITVVEEGAIAEDPKRKGVAGKLRTTAGAIWKVVKGGIGRVERMSPPTMSSGTVAFYEMMARECQNQTGAQDVALGRTARGPQTAEEVATLATNARLRSAVPTMLMDAWDMGIMERVVELNLAYMQPGDRVRILGDQNRDRVAYIDQLHLDAKFDLDMDVETTLPFDKERRKQDAERLYERIGLPYLGRLLEVFEVKDKDEILQAHGEYQAFLQYQQQIEAQQGQLQE